MNIGDTVRIVKLPPGLRDLEDLPTRAAFNLCLGHEYVIQDFGKYGHLELDVSAEIDEVAGGVGNTIWIEPEFVELVRKSESQSRK
jgi:hypothetical protein